MERLRTKAEVDAEQIYELSKFACSSVEDDSPAKEECLETLTTIYEKAPEWTTDQANIRKIVNSLDSYWSHYGQMVVNPMLAPAEGPMDNQLDYLDGQVIRYEDEHEERKNDRFADSVPTEVFVWIVDQNNDSGKGDPNAVVGRIAGDRTHVNIMNSTGYHRVAVSKLLDQFDAPKDIRRLMTMLPSKGKTDHVEITISRHPADILMKSTGQFWTSCESPDGCYNEGPTSDIEVGSAIAIVRKNKDTLSKDGNWAGRVMLRPCIDNEGGPNVGVEPRVYGDEQMEAKVISEIKNYLDIEHNLGNYDYCYTPYYYQGYSDQMGNDGVIVYGDKRAGMDRIADNQIESITKDLSHGVCKQWGGHSGQESSADYYGKYWEGDLGELYRQTRETHMKYSDAMKLIKSPSFRDVTNCSLEYLLSDYEAWRKLPELMDELMPRFKELFGDELYIMKDRQNHRDHLFAPGCRTSYNWSEYEILVERLNIVKAMLDHDSGKLFGDPRLFKEAIIETLDPFNKYGVFDKEDGEPRLLTEHYKEDRFMEDVCSDLMNEEYAPEPLRFGIGNRRVGYGPASSCPIDSPAADALRQRCKVWENDVQHPDRLRNLFLEHMKARIARKELDIDEARQAIRNYDMSSFSNPAQSDPSVRAFMRETPSDIEKLLDDVAADTRALRFNPVTLEAPERLTPAEWSARDRFINDLVQQRGREEITTEQFAERVQAYDALPEHYD